MAFEHRYRSAVIAWASEDDPTDREIEETLDQFEYVSWSGLEPDRYAWSAVLHRDDDGGAHVHVLAARVDLETGKSHNIAPPGWERTHGLLERAMNHERGWARPDDPDRARTTRPGRFPADAVDRDAIDGYLRQRVAAGLVHDRAGVVAAFAEAGYEVPRQGKNYLTVAHPETGRRLRLKGTLYEQDFQAAELRRQVERAGGAGPGGDRDLRPPDAGRSERADAAKEQLPELGETLRRYAAYELTQTTSAIRQQARRSIAAQWMRSLVISLGICMGIWSSFWAMGQWQHREIREKIELLDYLDRQIEDRNRTLNELSQEVE